MPGKSGLELLHEVIAEFPALPIIMVSGDSGCPTGQKIPGNSLDQPPDYSAIPVTGRAMAGGGWQCSPASGNFWALPGCWYARKRLRRQSLSPTANSG